MTTIYRTPDGGTIESTQRSSLTDLHVRAADGRTIATVHMSRYGAAALVLGLRKL